jgi:multidrug resistance protein MdtO
VQTQGEHRAISGIIFLRRISCHLGVAIGYIINNSIAWPGISTAVTTCLLTGLSTIGVSRQKQVLRFAGALVGGIF